MCATAAEFRNKMEGIITLVMSEAQWWSVL